MASINTQWANITLPLPAVISANNTRIPIIKLIREVTGLGLKEAKDLSDIPGVHRIELNGLTIKQAIQNNLVIPVLKDYAQKFKSLNIEFGPPVVVIIEELRLLGIRAIEQKEDELANEILALVLAEKMRRGC